MTPLELAMTSLAGYLGCMLFYARAAFRRFNWDGYTTEAEKKVFSLLQGVVWPVFWLTYLATVFIAAPTRTERQMLRRKQLQEDIRRLERELAIGPSTVTPTPAPELPDTLAGLLIFWLRNRPR